MLNKNEIAARGLIKNAVSKRYRDIGYDVGIGEIFYPLGDDAPQEDKWRRRTEGPKTVKQYKIPPQGVAILISQERVELPV